VVSQQDKIESVSVKEIIQICDRLSLFEADLALDDARRFIWIRQFSGAPDLAIKDQLSELRLDVALEIADRMIDIVSALEAESIIMEVRVAIWMAGYAAIPGSLFARQLRAHRKQCSRQNPVH
jgi:hypothetical protein